MGAQCSLMAALSFAACCSVVLLIIWLCCAWEQFDNSKGNVSGLSGIAAVSIAVLDRLEPQWELKLKGLWPVDESIQEQDTLKHLWPWPSPQQNTSQSIYGGDYGRDCGPCWSGYTSKHLWRWMMHISLWMHSFYHLVPEIKFEVITKMVLFLVLYRHSLEMKCQPGIM